MDAVCNQEDHAAECPCKLTLQAWIPGHPYSPPCHQAPVAQSGPGLCAVPTATPDKKETHGGAAGGLLQLRHGGLERPDEVVGAVAVVVVALHLESADRGQAGGLGPGATASGLTRKCPCIRVSALLRGSSQQAGPSKPLPPADGSWPEPGQISEHRPLNRH